jgi:hypothetical protein
MAEREVVLGRPRSSEDGCRRYRPIRVTFDTRNVALDVRIRDDWEPRIKATWERIHAQVWAELVDQFGALDADAKFENYRALGPAPWSVVFEHTVLLRQVRDSFTHGDFYPALVGACALGERLLHQLVDVLRQDYINHGSTTKRVRSGRLANDWGTLIDVLRGWGVLDDELAATYRELEGLRHRAVHVDRGLEVARRDAALTSILLLQRIVERVLEPHGGPPRYIADTPGASFLALEAEHEPIVKRIFLPHCALVTPDHRMEPDASVPGGWRVFDDVDYPCEQLSDEDFAARVRDSPATKG